MRRPPPRRRRILLLRRRRPPRRPGITSSSGDAPSDGPIAWRDDGLPASRLYGDVYFSSDDGLAEAQAVYLAGCGLPDAWAGRRRFTVGELGFGTGLNIAALLTLWRERRPPGATLQVFTIEAHPLARADAARALGRWPSIAPAAEALLAAWPSQAPGFHRIAPEGFDALIDLAVMDVATALAAWEGAADAWFLDGFSPALNPAMWSDEVLAAVAARSAPGARAATFTVAGGVRRGLGAAGFGVDKRPGFGRKRERLEARLPGEAAEAPAPTVAIVGAGIAGAALARAVRALGGSPRLFETEAAGAGASGNPAALVTPALDAGGGVRGRLFAQAFERAVALYERTGAVIARGALQLEAEPRDAARFDKVVAGGLFGPAALTRLSAEETSAAIGEAAAAGLRFEAGLVVAPRQVLAAWSGVPEIARIARLERGEGGWKLFGPDEALVLEAEVVILAAGTDNRSLWPGEAPIRPVRGQASWAVGPTATPAAFGGYAIPTGEGVLFGATFDRGDEGVDLREEDHLRNLTLVGESLPTLASRLAILPLEGRARLRATTRDHLPLAGRLDEGLFVLGGLGSRGFTSAPLLAEHVAALALGAPSPLPRDLAAAVDPRRFATPA
jgi:tRNA 5-methylaminomethyl-2-thiouridine biosynthesis bifunctional protein